MVKLTSFILAAAVGIQSVTAITSDITTDSSGISIPFSNAITNNSGVSTCGGFIGSSFYNESSIVSVDSPVTNGTDSTVCKQANCGDLTLCFNWVFNDDWTSVTSQCTTMLCRKGTTCYNFLLGTANTLSAIKPADNIYCFLYEVEDCGGDQYFGPVDNPIPNLITYGWNDRAVSYKCYLH